MSSEKGALSWSFSFWSWAFLLCSSVSSCTASFYAGSGSEVSSEAPSSSSTCLSGSCLPGLTVATLSNSEHSSCYALVNFFFSGDMSRPSLEWFLRVFLGVSNSESSCLVGSLFSLSSWSMRFFWMALVAVSASRSLRGTACSCSDANSSALGATSSQVYSSIAVTSISSNLRASS